MRMQYRDLNATVRALVPLIIDLIVLFHVSPADADAEVARPAHAFVDFVGVNTHLGYSDTTYGDYEGILKPRLLELGVRHIRDGTFNGEVLRKTANALRDNCLIYPDGSMVTFKRGKMDVREVVKEDIWQSFLFGPALLKADGSPYEKFSSNIGVANPRSVIGYFAPGHFCFVLVEGRQTNQKGLALVPLSNFMSELGCASAYNLDGGQSAMLWFNGQLVNNPYKGGRALTDIAYIGE